MTLWWFAISPAVFSQIPRERALARLLEQTYTVRLNSSQTAMQGIYRAEEQLLYHVKSVLSRGTMKRSAATAAPLICSNRVRLDCGKCESDTENIYIFIYIYMFVDKAGRSCTFCAHHEQKLET